MILISGWSAFLRRCLPGFLSAGLGEASSSGVMYASTRSKFGVYSEIPDMIQSIRKLVHVSWAFLKGF